MTPTTRPAFARLLAAGLSGLVLLQTTPALAMSTAQEVAQGAKENKAIDDQSVVIHDPFLTAWVNRIGSNLAAHRTRHDIDYRFTVIDDQSINAFAIKGGFVHVNVGLLNFVTSDDQLASTLGHEMGHVELHHVTKGGNVSTIIGVIESILSIISIPAAIIGSIGGDLASQKYSRMDELQADKYGLSIMTQAGYDPQAAVDVMRMLGSTDPGPETRVEKAFIDHPIPADRVAHLSGYPQLDRVSSGELVSRAAHDAAEGRYSYAQAVLHGVAHAHPAAVPAVDVQQLDYALRESGPLAAPDGRSSAPVLPDFDTRRTAALAALNAARQAQNSAFNTSKDAGRLGELELSDLESRMQASTALAAAVQEPAPAQPAHAQPARAGANAAPDPPPQLADILDRDLNELANLTDDVYSNAPGLLRDEGQTIDDLSSPLAEPGPPTPKYAALFAYYPAMTSDLASATTGYSDSLVKARASIAAVTQALLEFNASVAHTQAAAPNRSSTRDPRTMQRLHGAAVQFSNDVEAALKVAQAAATEMYAAQTAQLSTQLSMLDLYSSPERYEAYRRALEFRFPGTHPPAYAQALALSLPAGELACDAWLAFETNRQVATVATPMKGSGSPCIAAGLSGHLSTESMEIAEGLVFQDYDEAPQH